jgi:hypothetical protein
MATYDYMHKRTYDELDGYVLSVNSTEYAVDQIRETARGLFPDSWAGEPRIDELTDAINYFEDHAQNLVAELRKLIAQDKRRNS